MFNCKNNRSQAALEFLTTYGWAFLVILVMMGALSYFGVLNPGNLIPDVCTASDGFTCKEFAAREGVGQVSDGSDAEFILVNSLQAIRFTSNPIVSIDSASSCGSPQFAILVVGDTPYANSPITAQSGELIKLNLICWDSDALLPGERIVGTISFNYTLVSGSLPRTGKVDFSLKAQ